MSAEAHLTPREHAVALAHYNRWMNEKLYDAAARLTDEQRKRDLGAFFHSIHGTLNHLLLGDQAWLQRLHGQRVTMTSPGQQLFSDFRALQQARRAMDDELIAWAEGLDEASEGRMLSFYSVTYQRERRLPQWLVVTHLFNHQTHHRGQISTLLSQLGVDIGVTDMPWMPYLD